MLIKEYRVLMPLTVDEYRIAQLYMIAKKSRLDSSGKEHGVEIITNRPYTDSPGGSGQYTFKVYHIGSRIPTWIRSILPSSALEAHEEAWNAYPYTKTRYTCPMLGDRFNIEVETHYVDDAAKTENKFNLPSEESKNCTIDILDFVKDPISHHDYSAEEDPKIYKSAKTQRGPLSDNWVQEFLDQNRPVMCAYKICRVEFRYWGLQTRVERWIHEFALRGTMLRAHRQAWAWQDEWVGMKMEDIRKYEEDTARYLSEVMASTSPHHSPTAKIKMSGFNQSIDSEDSINLPNNSTKSGTWAYPCRDEQIPPIDEECSSLVSSDIFFDCCDDFPEEATEHDANTTQYQKQRPQQIVQWNSELLQNCESESNSPVTPKWQNHDSSLLILVFHADFYPSISADSKITDVNTLRSTIEHLITSHYPFLKSRVCVKRVACGSEFGNTLSMLEGIFPSGGMFHPSLGILLSANQTLFCEAIQSTIQNANKVMNEFLTSDEGRNFAGEIFAIGDSIGGILLYEALAKNAQEVNGPGPISRNSSSISAHSSPYFSSGGKEASLNPSSRSLYSYPLDDGCCSKDPEEFPQMSKTLKETKSSRLSTGLERYMSAPPTSSTHLSQGLSESAENVVAFSFHPNATFLLGCPLSQLLIQKKLATEKDDLDLRIDCDQLFNIFYPMDLLGVRLEPILNPQLALLPALNIPRYQRYPLGNGQTIQFDQTTKASMVWGDRRVDHQLFCPQEMNTLPPLVLPSILHASYWESKDVSAFILRQFVRPEQSAFFSRSILSSTINESQPEFQIPSTSWNKRRTRFKIANLSANHRANDVIVIEGSDQIINAKFCYGPMDLVALSLEDILVYVCFSGGEWFQHSTETTDKNGRLTVNFGKLLPVGLHSIRLIVHGDLSFVSMFVAVAPPKTPVVVFSIDGSLTGSVSVTGRDPRLRPGAVDLVRFWQQQGYIVIYLTARPDFSQRLISAWLNQHNFPHGLLFFTPSISTDPLRQKGQYLRHLVDIGLKIQAGYGSAKDVQVYAMAGLTQEQIFIVGSHKRRGCMLIEDGYSQHLQDLQTGKIAIAQPVISPAGGQAFFPTTASLSPNQHPFVSRTVSFTPRSGKYREKCDSLTTTTMSVEKEPKKHSQISTH